MIETAGLVLRPCTVDDVGALHEILSDPITMRFWPRPFGLEETQRWVERNVARYAELGFSRYAMILKETGALVGDCGIVPSVVNGAEVIDIGYILHHPHWGHGLATEAAAAVRDHAFDVLGLPALHANMAHDNHASRRVAEKIGMTMTGEFLNERNRGIRTFLFELKNG